MFWDIDFDFQKIKQGAERMLKNYKLILMTDGKIAEENVRIHQGLAGLFGPDALYSLGIAKEKALLGFLPIWTVEQVLDIRISPSARKNVEITVYSEQGLALAQSEYKRTSYGFIPWAVNITKVFPRKSEGSLSLITQDGKLSEVPQNGELALSKAEKKGP